MAAPCSICTRKDRATIDAELVSGRPVRAIARQFHAGRDSLARHQASHLSAALVKMAAQREERQARTLLERMEALIERTERLLEAAENSGAVGQALSAIDRLWKGYEMVGKLTGELKPDGPAVAINILQAPEIQLYLSVVRDVVGAARPDLLPVIAERLALPDTPAWSVRANEVALGDRGAVLRKTSGEGTAPTVNGSLRP